MGFLERRDVARLVRLATRSVGRRDRTLTDVGAISSHTARAVVTHAVLHRVEGCVHEALHDLAGVPDQLVSPLAAARRTALAQHLQTLAMVRRIGGVLDAESIPWLVMKGPVLASVVYRDPSLRSSIDLDLLVARRHFGAAVHALEAAGYEPLFRNWPWVWNARAGELPFGGGPVTLDAHWHLMLGEYDRRSFAFEPAAFMERARTVDIGGVHMATFDPVDTVLHVAFHAAHSGADRLVWLKDVERCLAVAPVDFDEVVARARAARCQLPVGLALARARRTMGAAVPDGVPETLVGRSAVVVDALLTRAFPVERTVDRATPATMVARCALGSHRDSLERFGGTLQHWRRTRRVPGRHLDEHDPSRSDSPTRPIGTDADKERFLDWVSAG